MRVVSEVPTRLKKAVGYLLIESTSLRYYQGRFIITYILCKPIGSKPSIKTTFPAYSIIQLSII